MGDLGSAFVEAARLIGCSGPRILLRHLFPNIVTPLLVVGTLQVARFIIGDVIKIALAAAVLPTGWALIGRRSGLR